MTGHEVGKVCWIRTAEGFAYPEQGVGMVLWSHYQVSIRGWAVDDMITESCFRKGLAGAERMNWRETSCMTRITSISMLFSHWDQGREELEFHKFWKQENQFRVINTEGFQHSRHRNYRDGFCLSTLVFPMMLCTWWACYRKFVEWMNAHLLGTTSESKTKCAQKLDIDNTPDMPRVTAYYTHLVKSSLCNKPSYCAP